MITLLFLFVGLVVLFVVALYTILFMLLRIAWALVVWIWNRFHRSDDVVAVSDLPESDLRLL